MKAASIILPLAVLSLASTAFAQSGTATTGAQTASSRVIVPWTHFGQDPPPPPSSDPNDPPQTSSPQAATVQSNNSAPPPTNDPVEAADTQSAQPAGGPSPQPQLYEADISKKHPHPPEPVALPLSDQSAAPVSSILSGQPLEPAAGGDGSGPAAPSGSATAGDHSPEGQIAALTAGYQKREADRQARRAQLEAAGAQDPNAQALVQIEQTRLLLEGEKDRMATSQQLAAAFAALGEELDARAHKVRDLVESRNETAVTAEAELNQLNDVVPRRELALRNLAMLPASDQNDEMIRGLSAELAQEEGARKLDEERSQEARSEFKALQAESGQLEQAAAEARRKSSRFADAARSAQVNENLLADRLEYSVARMRTADLLTNASKALDHSGAFKDNVQIGPLPAASAAPAPPTGAAQAVDQLRDCIRKTGNPDACRAKGDQ
jgi:hypothetical protein